MAELDPLLDPDYRYSINRLLGDGTKLVWDVNFAGGFISRDHIKLYVINPDGTTSPRLFTWITDSSISITPSLALNEVAICYRDTPKDAPLVNFSDGSVFNESNLDTLAEQSVFVAAETLDRFADVSDVSAAANVTATAALAAVTSATANSAAAVTTANAAAGVASAAGVVAAQTAAQFGALLETVDDIVGEDLTSLARLDTVQSWPAGQTFVGLSRAKSDFTQRIDISYDGTYRLYASGNLGPVKTINDWNSFTSIPSSFPPSAHNHTIANVTGLQTALDAKKSNASFTTDFTWGNLPGKPSTFAPSVHTHAWADITSGVPAFKPITISTSNPSGGNDGDVWIVY